MFLILKLCKDLSTAMCAKIDGAVAYYYHP